MAQVNDVTIASGCVRLCHGIEAFAPLAPVTKFSHMIRRPSYVSHRSHLAQPQFSFTCPMRICSTACAGSATKAGYSIPSNEHSSHLPSETRKNPSHPETFRDTYGEKLPPWLLSRLDYLEFTRPTAVQSRALPLTLPRSTEEAGRDVVIHAQTGSGKTLAYLLPALTAIDPARACTQVLIVVPTQELGMQVYKLLRRLVSAFPHKSASAEATSREIIEDEDLLEDSSIPPTFPVLPMLDQADLRRQKLQLRKAAPRAVVGNPKRLAQLVESGRLRLDLLKVLVVDEFDACLLDVSTTQALQSILGVRNRERARQTILASATVPQHRHFLRQCVRQHWTRPDIEHVWVEEASGERVPLSLTHTYALCDGRKKLAALRALLVRCGRRKDGTEGLNIRAMVFVMPSRSIQEIVDALNKCLGSVGDGTSDISAGRASPVVGINNDVPIVHRREAMRRFRCGDAQVLVGTDLTARGLDVPDVSHVFHFDLPTDPDAYLHRAGRTGRQGRPGSSVVLISPGEEFVINRMANALGIEFGRIGR